jgi:GT2 family glycosyltransferase
LNYPDYEVLLVDDGSTDTTPQIAQAFRQVRYIRHEKNQGLSAARNAGIAAALGEVVAFTDADCRADEDWLHYLAEDLADGDFSGMGGPNLLPPDDSPVGATVMASPGGPAHVMLTDRRAEHIPGCNMAFVKSALVEIGGFDPILRKAGDDVDVCWRLEQAGCEIGFSPSAQVWHYRRSTVADYLKQQRGYGEAEALLVRKHPEYFNSIGGSLWRGRIYAAPALGLQLRRAMIYHGPFGSAGFQGIYAAEPASSLMLCTTLEYHIFVTLPLWVLSTIFTGLLPLAVTSVLLSLGLCAAAGAQASLPPNRARWWSRPLVALLFLLQPIVRGWARYWGRISVRSLTLAAQESLDSVALRQSRVNLDETCYWAGTRLERLDFVAAVVKALEARGWPSRSDIGWSEYDVEVYGSRWIYLQLTTVAEEHPKGRQLIRCRLRTPWSLFARICFWSLAGGELLIISLLGVARAWPWLILLALPSFAWFVARERRSLQSVAVTLLDDVAKSCGLLQIRSKPGAGSEDSPGTP